MTAPPRSLLERIADTRSRLAEDVDCWVASSGRRSAAPYLVPLSFWWDGSNLWFATATSSPTVRNLLAGGRTRAAVGLIRDVVMIDGTVAGVPATQVDAVVGDEFATKSGFDPRGLSAPYTYLRVTPVRIQAWREENELAERDVMRDGVWLTPC